MMREAEARTFASLEECETAIERFISSYEDAGQALLDIHGDELWREAHFESFEEYVFVRWQFTLGRASQLMSAGRFLRHMANEHSALPPPATERHFRPLMRIRPDGKNMDAVWDARLDAWQVVCDRANGAGVTVEFVEGIVQDFVGEVPAPMPKQLTIGDLTAAWELIARFPVSPEQAVANWGKAAGWTKFEEAFAWMEKARSL